MALVNKIRQRATVAIGVIAFALILFIVGTDWITSTGGMQGERPIVGTVNGQDIDQMAFQEEVDRQRRKFEAQMGTPVNETQMPYIRNLAWETFLFRFAFYPEYDKLGLGVTDEEIKDMVQGSNIAPEIKQLFTNPQTGEFNRDQVIQFLQNLQQYPPETRELFYSIERELPVQRIRNKYDNLLELSTYVTKAEAKQRYNDQNSEREIQYLYVPYTSIPDSAISVSDKELKAYYDANKAEFEGPATITLEYVAMPIKPSTKDTTSVRTKTEELREQFKNTDNDTLFVNTNSQRRRNIQSLLPSELPDPFKNAIPEIGTVSQIQMKGEDFTVYKYLGTIEDTITSMRASHVLIRSDDADADSLKTKAEATANEVLAKARSGEDFAALAREYSEDGSKNQGGDLGWFTEGIMVEPFEKAVLGFEGTGVIPKVVKSQFGYHIIKVTEPKTNRKHLVASFTRTLLPTAETRDNLYRTIGVLATAGTYDEYLKEVAKQPGVISMQANDLQLNARNLNNLQDQSVRQILTRAYRQTKDNEVINEVFEVDNNYVVVVRKSVTPEGIKPFEAVKEKVKAEVIKDKKAEQIIAKLQGESGSIDELAQKVEKARSFTATVNNATLQLTGTGFAPRTIGTAFALEQGAQSKPIQDATGVFIVKVKNIDNAAEVADYTQYRKEIVEDRSRGSRQKVKRAVSELTDTKNKIDQFY
ncbi:MAG: peptidylprolyl isomerase [Bernardetiaceae bacterium]|nr:peptidylprolyl isomerase [Bernardetiaceae bacterium]